MIQTVLLILILIVSVAAGLWVGNSLGHQSRRALKSKKGKAAAEASIGKHAQDLVTGAVVKLWRWRRERSRERKDG